ncbi:aspartate transaminase aat1 [Cryptotrichosporon argae]
MRDNAASGDQPADGLQPDAPDLPSDPSGSGAPPQTDGSADGLGGVDDDDLHTQRLADAVRAVAEQHMQADAAEDADGGMDVGAGLVEAMANAGTGAADDDETGFPHFDEDTLANIAALTRIGAEDDADGDGAGELDLGLLQLEQQLTNQQVQDFVKQLHMARRDERGDGEGEGEGAGAGAGGAAEGGRREGASGPEGEEEGEQEEGADGAEAADGTEAATEGGDEEYPAPKGTAGPQKRRRQRTVL